MKVSLKHNWTTPSKVSQDSIKQELFVRTHYIDGLTREFEKVQLMPAKKRQSWITDNQEMLGDVLDSLLIDSDLAVDGVNLDSQAMQMSLDFMSKLKKAATMMKQIVREGDRIEN